MNQRKNPALEIAHWTYPGTEDVFYDMTKRNLIWVLIRLHKSQSEQKVPDWTGFISATGQAPKKFTTIDYYLESQITQ